MAVSYFFRVAKDADLTPYQTQHDLVFPGNRVAALDDAFGTLLVKVAYKDGTPMPSGAISFAKGAAELAAMAVMP